MHNIGPIDWREIEDRIRPHVKFLREAGYKTTGSCGHDMWITIDCEPMELPALESTLKAGGYRDFEVSYTAHEGFRHWRGARVNFGGELSGDGKPFDLVCLRVRPDAHPLYLVISARRWPHSDRRVDEGTEESDDRYFYDEYTCPTNWTQDIVAVISDSDEDPHGFAEFVERVVPPDDMDKNGYPEPADGWLSIFPKTSR